MSPALQSPAPPAAPAPAPAPEHLTRRLGALDVGPQGLGCMGMSEFRGPTDAREAAATVRRAVELGVTLLDTADLYGDGANERFLADALAHRRRRVHLATKCGLVRTGPHTREVRGDPAHIRRSCIQSLARLRTDHIDLYYLHRVDPAVPIEESVGAMADLVRAGMIGHIGLSEASAATIRRAHAVHPIAAVQNEWSLFTRTAETDIVPLCQELNIGIVAFSPLSRGLLTGRIATPADLHPSDDRRRNPRFSPRNLARNLRLITALHTLANQRNVTTAQLALAWLHHQGPNVVALPGAERRTHLEENLAATAIRLTAHELQQIEDACPAPLVAGERCSAERAGLLGG